MMEAEGRGWTLGEGPRAGGRGQEAMPCYVMLYYAMLWLILHRCCIDEKCRMGKLARVHVF